MNARLHAGVVHEGAMAMAEGDRTSENRALGRSLPRKEDERLLRGDGRFVDDVQHAHQLEMAVLRCPFPHARIRSVDVAAALALPGVRHILSAEQVRDLSEPLTVLRPVPGAPSLPYYALAQGTALYEGHPVVSVVAVSRAVAEDALELIDVDYEPLPHVSDALASLEPDAPVLHPGTMSSNLMARHTDSAGEPSIRMQEALHIVEDTLRVGRVTPLPMETRGIVAVWRPGARELLVNVSTQTPHLVRKQLAESLRLSESSIQVVARDVGGGFGQKLGAFPEDVLACLHAMALRRPVKWIEDRMEHFRASTHGRESVYRFCLAADGQGRFVGITNDYVTDIGAWNSPFGSAQLASVVFTGPYKVPDAEVTRRVVLTNKTPVGAYRGYGQPEVNFALEVMVDRMARKLKMDPFELRQKNLLQPQDLPWTTPSGAVYDSGDYPVSLRMAADAVSYQAHRASPRTPRADGLIVGIGFSSFVERTGYASARFLAKRGSQFGAHESLTLRANRSGGVDVYTGVSSIGQSGETAIAQLCADALGIDYDRICVHSGDTASSPLNTGAFASRTLIAVAGAVREAAKVFQAKVLRLAAWSLEVESNELCMNGSVVRMRNDAGTSVPLEQVFTCAIVGQGIPADDSPGLEATSHFEPPEAAFAFGAAAAVVAVDPLTGEFQIERFVIVHDCGVVVNPKVVDGQVRGALVQGLGAALGEELRYDDETGQLVSGSMLDYFVPSAADVPPIELLHTAIPSPVTPYGIRGVGEVGTIPPGAAIANALCDALSGFGVEISSLPITPESVWRAIEKAKAGVHGGGT